MLFEVWGYFKSQFFCVYFYSSSLSLKFSSDCILFGISSFSYCILYLKIQFIWVICFENTAYWHAFITLGESFRNNFIIFLFIYFLCVRMWMSKDDLQELVLSTHHVGSRDWTQQDGLPAHGDTFLLVFFVWDLTLIRSWFSFFTWNWFPWTWGSFVWLHRLSTPHSVVWQWAWPYSGISLETSWLSSLSHFYPDSALLLGTLFCSDFIWSLRISSCWATSAQRYPWLIFPSS